MGILENILNLFKTPDIKETKPKNIQKVPIVKLPALNKIGVDTLNCPYCNAELKKFPARKTKCKNCGQYMYVRTRPLDYKKILLKESELSLLEEEWEKRSYINEKTKASQSANINKNSLVIDASSEMNAIIKDLTRNYKGYCNYDEMLRIDEKDRLPILKYIWSKWMVHSSSIEKDLKYSYPQYDFKDIRLITFKEHKRIIAFQKVKQYKDLGITFLEYYSDKEQNYYRTHPEKSKDWIRICYVEDMPNVTDAWFTDEKHIDKYTFLITMPNLYSRLNNRRSITLEQEPEYVELWQNGKINKMSIEDFYEYCEENNIDIIIDE